MYNLLEYIKKYRKTTGSLWNYYREEPSNPLSSDSESFKYKTSIAGKTYNLNCEMELVLTWYKNYVLADVTVRDAGNNDDPSAIVAPTGLEFQITDTKLYVPVVTLSTEND